MTSPNPGRTKSTVSPTMRRSKARTAEAIRRNIENIEQGSIQVGGTDPEGRPWTEGRKLKDLRRRLRELES